jgi:hypothetical protein
VSTTKALDTVTVFDVAEITLRKDDPAFVPVSIRTRSPTCGVGAGNGTTLVMVSPPPERDPTPSNGAVVVEIALKPEVSTVPKDGEPYSLM